MKVLTRRSPGSFTRNQKTPEFRRPGFATRLLLSVLSTLIALEPTAVAQQGAGARVLPPGHLSPPPVRFLVQADVSGDLPSGGYLDRFHNAKDALANSKPGFWKCNLPFVGDVTKCENSTPNVASLMYAMRNTAIQASLERQMGIRYLIGGDHRAEKRFEDLRGDFFERSWFGTTGLFDGEVFTPDFKIPASVTNLYVGSPHGGPPERKVLPTIGEYISWLEHPVSDPMMNAESVRAVRKMMVPALIERALAMIEADGEFKYYTSDYLQDYRVKEQFVRPYVKERLSHRTHRPSPYVNAKVGDLDAVRAETDAHWAYRKLTVDPDPNDENGNPIEFPLPPLLQANRMEIAAILAFRQSIGDNPLLVVPVKGRPLYQLVHELIGKISMRDPENGSELKIPDPKNSHVPKDAKLVKRGEKIPPPVTFTTQLSKVKRFLGAYDTEKPYRYITESSHMMAAFDDLIDAALLTYLFATKQLMKQVTKRVDWDGDIRSEWARLVDSDAIYNRTVADYAYLYRAAAKRAPASEDMFTMHVNFPEARKLLLEKIERRRKIISYATYTLDAIVLVGLLAIMIVAPESSPFLAWMGVFRTGWLLVFELGLLAMTSAYTKWQESEFSRKLVRDSYLAVPGGSDDEVQAAAKIALEDYKNLTWTVIVLGGLPVFKQLVSVYRGVRAANALVKAEQLAALDAGGEALAASGRSLGSQGRRAMQRLRDVLMKTGLAQQLPKLWGFVKSPYQSAVERLNLGSNFTQVFRSEMMADIGFQLFAEAVNRRQHMLGSQSPEFAVDMINGAVMTALMVVLAFKAPTLNGRALPTDFTQPLREMDPIVVNALGRGWNNKDRVAGFLLNSFRYCAVGYASGVTGGALLKTVQNHDKPMTTESVEDAFRDLNRQGWFLCNFAWAWSQPRMQAQNVWRRKLRDKYGVRTSWDVDPMTNQYGQNLVYPPNWTQSQIDDFLKKYARPSQASNLVSTLTWPWLARKGGVEKEHDWSEEIDVVPDSLYLKMEIPVDPVGLLFQPMEDYFPRAPLAKENGDIILANESLEKPGAPAAPAPPASHTLAAVPAEEKPRRRHGSSALTSLWGKPPVRKKTN